MIKNYYIKYYNKTSIVLDILIQVKPKMDRVRELEAESEKAAKALKKEEQELERLEQLLEGLNIKYETALEDRQRIQEETDLLKRRLIAADKLIGYIFQSICTCVCVCVGVHKFSFHLLFDEYILL
jgi:molecular chaperone GrpE (heat shock protein)